MKNKLLLLAVALLTSWSVKAVDVIEEGVNYYILSVETDLFLGAQNNWGTNSAISTDAGIFQFVPGATGEGYNIVNTLVSVANKNLGTNLYTDNNGLATVIDDEEAGTTKSVDGIWSIENQGGGIFAFRFLTATWPRAKQRASRRVSTRSSARLSPMHVSSACLPMTRLLPTWWTRLRATT